MIVTPLSSADRYAALHPRFGHAFEFLRAAPLSSMPAGRHEIDGDRLFVVINRVVGRGRGNSPLEYHRRYIDIQYTLIGPDEIGWRPLSECSAVQTPYSDETDFGLFQDTPKLWLSIAPGECAIFFSEDAHAPQGAECELVKAVMKVLV